MICCPSFFSKYPCGSPWKSSNSLNICHNFCTVLLCISSIYLSSCISSFSSNFLTCVLNCASFCCSRLCVVYWIGFFRGCPGLLYTQSSRCFIFPSVLLCFAILVPLLIFLPLLSMNISWDIRAGRSRNFTHLLFLGTVVMGSIPSFFHTASWVLNQLLWPIFLG